MVTPEAAEIAAVWDEFEEDHQLLCSEILRQRAALSAAEDRVETLQRDVLQALIVQVDLDRSTAYWGERWDWFPDEVKAWLSSLIDFGWTATAVPGMPQPTQGDQR